MEQSHGRPATQIEVEAFSAIARLYEENRELRLEIQRLQRKVDSYEYLRTSEPKICDKCFTSTWQPCSPDTPDCAEDNQGGWMVCGHCRLVVEYEQVSNKLTICEDFITRLRKEKSK